ncbi:LAME_0B03092g1_1 [Lachancea meyersii CBS 8951]|uniref:LAME_0B03092g1_1 n=1 Tax=Lachancea meyersii CBS 8951 TaxID=1266667 RepID=A0A1G4IU20_9SACH|nr:LAME_0B03092g1_1 [Lachancea meyersii CBS 8951]
MVSDAVTKAPAFIHLTTNNGPLAQIWLASNMSHSLSKSVSQHTDIIKSVEEIARVAGCSLDSDIVEPITLRASGELLHGVVRVYSKKTSLLLNDIKDTLTRMTTLFKSAPPNVTLQIERTTLPHPSQYLLQDAVTEREVLQVPGLEFLNEQPIVRGFMGHERSMERHVQGAAPWDSSIEIGRNARVGEELGHNQSSVLDLDFDIDDTDTRAVGEGTNTTINKSNQTTGSAIIQEDDFPADDHLDWDLGIQDQSMVDAGGQDEDRSLELGRRAAVDESAQDQTEFDFDLGLGKDLDDEALNSGAEEDDFAAPVSSPPDTQGLDQDLSQLKRLITDKDTELRDEEVRISQLSPDSQIIEQHAARPRERLNAQKRLWVQIADKTDYLPETILGTFLSYQNLKKPRVSPELPQAVDEDPQFDVSLDLGNDLGSSLENAHEPHQENEEDLATLWEDERDIGNDEPEDEIVNGTRSSIDTSQDISFQGTLQERERHSTNTRLVTGEYVSRGLGQMAERLKTRFIDVDSTNFSDCLRASQEGDAPSKKDASKTFFELLSLANMGCVDLDQQTNFGEIDIISKSSLYSKFVVA